MWWKRLLMELHAGVVGSGGSLLAPETSLTVFGDQLLRSGGALLDVLHPRRARADPRLVAAARRRTRLDPLGRGAHRRRPARTRGGIGAWLGGLA